MNLLTFKQAMEAVISSGCKQRAVRREWQRAADYIMHTHGYVHRTEKFLVVRPSAIVIAGLPDSDIPHEWELFEWIDGHRLPYPHLYVEDLIAEDWIVQAQ